MRDLIINQAMMKIKNNTSYDKTKLLEIKYGLSSLYLTITKIIVILGINLIINTFKECLLFLLMFSILRLTSFGVHTKKSYQCWISSIIIFTLVPYLIKNYNFNINIIYIISLISFVNICLYAPADTEKRPLINKKKRIIFKIVSIISSLIYIIVIFLLQNACVTSLLFYSLVLDAIVINPVTYKLFGVKYNNYKNYRERRI